MIAKNWRESNLQQQKTKIKESSMRSAGTAYFLEEGYIHLKEREACPHQNG